jgi:hypothetical protein
MPRDAPHHRRQPRGLAPLPAGVLADLRRFEGNFVARCQQRAP